MRELRAPFLATGAATGVLLPFVAPILAGRGFSPQSIGLLLAITSAAIVVAAPIWGQVGDVVLGRRRTLQWAVLIAAAASILLAGRLALPLVAAAVATQYLLQTAFSALLDSIAMHALGDERHRYGHLRLLQSLSYAIAAFAAGVIYDRAGYGAAAHRVSGDRCRSRYASASRARPAPNPARRASGCSSHAPRRRSAR